MAESMFKILVVDDEEEIARSIIRYLSFLPDFSAVSILSASTFEEARVLIEEHKPHVVLQDINLPDGNGLQLIKQIKKTYPVVQFIVITGASSLDRVMDALALGASDYVKKPLDMSRLGEVVGDTLKRIGRWGELFAEEYMADGGDGG